MQKYLFILLFLSFSCEEPTIDGCTTSTACNYNIDADKDDGSCIAPQGCNEWCEGDTTAIQELDICGVCNGDGTSCYGCTDVTACNFDSTATIFDNSCWYTNIGCECSAGEGAFVDNCDICVGGGTGGIACVQDCADEWGGNADIDCTGRCVNIPNTCTVYDVDGYGYTTVIIGEQEWFVQNLKTIHYSNGDTIPIEIDDYNWSALNEGAYSILEHDTNNVDIYGILYNWYVISDVRGICPESFHVPSRGEWTTLTDYLGGESVAGGKMKEVGTIENGDGLWLSPNTGATNETGFTAIPSGSVSYSFGPQNKGYSATYWSSTLDGSSIRFYTLSKTSTEIFSAWSQKNEGHSIRCLKD